LGVELQLSLKNVSKYEIASATSGSSEFIGSGSPESGSSSGGGAGTDVFELKSDVS
jgi:hypothetical protein